MTRRFEFVGGSSAKFWEATVEGSKLTVCWGRLGTDGQRQMKSFPSSKAASKEAAKLIAQKTKKGYREVSHAAA